MNRQTDRQTDRQREQERERETDRQRESLTAARMRRQQWKGPHKPVTTGTADGV